MPRKQFNQQASDALILTVEDAKAHAGVVYDVYTEIECVRELDGPKGSGASRQYRVYGRTASADLSDKHVALFNSAGTFKGAGKATDPKFWEAIKENDLRSTQVGDFVDEVTALTVIIADEPFPGEPEPSDEETVEEVAEEATEEECQTPSRLHYPVGYLIAYRVNIVTDNGVIMDEQPIDDLDMIDLPIDDELDTEVTVNVKDTFTVWSD